MKEKKSAKTKIQKRKRLSKSGATSDPSPSHSATITSSNSVEPVLPASITNYDTLPLESVVTPGEIVVKPDLPKAMITIIRPRTIQKQESITGKVTEAVESIKDKTEEVIDTLASTAGIGVNRTLEEIGTEPFVIPIIEEKISTETKSYTETVRIEKRLVEKKKTLDVTVNSEEIFVNGKQVEPGVSETLKDIKDKLLDVISFDQNKEERDKGEEQIPGEKVPLFGNDTEMEKVVPIYAEELIVSKRFVKVADITIRKRKVTEVSKVDVGTATEELTIRNPTGISPVFDVDN